MTESIRTKPSVRPGARLQVPDGVDAPLGEPLAPLPVGRVGSSCPAPCPPAVGGIWPTGDGLVLSLTESCVGPVPGDVVSTEDIKQN